MKNFVKISMIMMGIIIAYAFPLSGYDYEVQKTDGHVIHIVTIDPEKYNTELVKARNTVIGRETVSTLAEYSNATLAINSGFFEIGHSQDGRPSRTLVIDNIIYNLTTQLHPVLKIRSAKVAIETINPQIYLKVNQEKISVRNFNQHPKVDEAVLFTPANGSRTFTSFKNRKEIAFNNAGNFIKLFPCGNNLIPDNGFIVSLPKTFPLGLPEKSQLQLIIDPLFNQNTHLSMVSGIPHLLDNGEIAEGIANREGTFYQLPHARTAVGIKADGTLVIIVAEHSYQQDWATSTFKTLECLLREKTPALREKYNKSLNELTLKELQEITKAEFADHNGAKGLTILETAQLMRGLGCQSALNLDGGGSSTLWIEGGRS